MHGLDAPGYWLARLAFQRLLAVVYVVAFVAAARQFRPLLGEHGMLPVPELLRLAPRLRGPSVFRWGYTDRRLVSLAIAGMVLAASVVAGLPQLGPPWVPMLVLLALWILYLSIVNVGQTFYGFGWSFDPRNATVKSASQSSISQPKP